jgi:uncharacterized protein YdhG (YjbR/CyaY superfamily)
MANSFQSVDLYLSIQPPEKEVVLQELRTFIKELLPNSTELISYQMPAYKQYKIIIWFAACNNHFSIYMKPKFYLGFEKERSNFKGTKSAIHFKWDKELPKSFLSRLILKAKELDETEFNQRKKMK